MSWSPQDLPYLRDTTVRASEALVEGFNSLTAFPGLADSLGGLIQGVAQRAEILDKAALTWLDSDVSTMVAETASGVPEWTPEVAMPTRFGLIAFEAPPLLATTTDLTGRTSVPVKAIGWGVDGDDVVIFWLADSRELPPLAMVPRGAEPPLTDVGHTRVPLSGVVKDNPVAALAGAAWLLMAQRTFVEDGEPVTAVVKQRGAARARHGKVRPVSVSYKRLTETYRNADNAGGGTGTGRKATRRWWVRGHWRNQAWGKNRQLRKPVFIAPHTAGAPGVEPERPNSVQVWRKD